MEMSDELCCRECGEYGVRCACVRAWLANQKSDGKQKSTVARTPAITVEYVPVWEDDGFF